MMLVLTSLAAISPALAQSSAPAPRFLPVGDTIVHYTFDAVPRWSGGALVAVESNRSAVPVVRIFDTEGRQTIAISVGIPRADWIDVRRAAHGVDGTTAICGSSKDSEAHVAGFLALASADGNVRRVIRTEPYVATAVAVSPDGTIWTKGAEFVPGKRTPTKTDNGIIRHFDASGNVLATFLPQSSLSRAELFLGIDQLASNSSRVGWYQGRGATTYYEVVGDRLERYPAIAASSPEAFESISGLTITDGNQVFVTKSVSGRDPELRMLDRRSRSWIRVALPAGGSPPSTEWLLGGSGNILVFKTIAQSGWLRRFEISAPVSNAR